MRFWIQVTSSYVKIVVEGKCNQIDKSKLNKGDYMPNSINDYRQLIDKPWGRMFYDIIFRQLNLSDETPLRILDFGAGFCVTANHYSEHHIVTAVEPNEEMIRLSIRDNHFDLIHGGIETLGTYSDNSFDFVICHNVLEYASNKEQILHELARILKPSGKLSIVKHNFLGKIIANAVFADNPNAALNLLNNGGNKKNLFGRCIIYDDNYIIELVRKYGLSIENIFGIRTFFALSKNEDIKYTQVWYDKMLALEMKTCDVHEINSFSFFHHLIFQKEEGQGRAP